MTDAPRQLAAELRRHSSRPITGAFLAQIADVLLAEVEKREIAVGALLAEVARREAAERECERLKNDTWCQVRRRLAGL